MKTTNVWSSELYQTIKGDTPKPLYDVPNNDIAFGVSDTFTKLLGKVLSFELQFLLQDCYNSAMSAYTMDLSVEIKNAFNFELMDQVTLDRVKMYLENHERNLVISKQPTFSQLLMEKIGTVAGQLERGGIVFEYEQGNLTLLEECCAELST